MTTRNYSSKLIRGLVVCAALLMVSMPMMAQFTNCSGGVLCNPGAATAVGGPGNPGYNFMVQSPGNTVTNFALYTNSTNACYTTFVNQGGGAYFGVENAAGNGILNQGALPYALVFQASGFTSAVQFSTAGTARLTVLPSGNVGIGTNNPTAKLDVVGDVNVSGNIAAKYQDVAEWVPSKETLVAGTVVVLDPAQINHVMSSSTAYDTTVAGVVSNQPGVLLGEPAKGSAKIATTGRVKVRVDATASPIRVGDLLVTSAKRGVAMRSTELDLGGIKIHRPGTIIGKALEPLAKGEAEILVLLSMQ